MTQTLQLRIGQHLTMTPQLQQATRLLQLSTVELQTEVQEQLDSNLMLETAVEDGPGPVSLSEADTAWEEVYHHTPATNFSAGGGMPVVEHETQGPVTENLTYHLRWQLGLTHFTDVDAVIAEHIIDARRPVAKYREAMTIPSSSDRKRLV